MIYNLDSNGMGAFKEKYRYRCVDCGAKYESDQVHYLCPHCQQENISGVPPKGVLKVVYDYEGLKKRGVDFSGLTQSKFIDLLPINSIKSLPPLRVGQTPLYKVEALGAHPLPYVLYLKDDGQNPTYSFKDRASALVSAFAKEHHLETIVAASTGNAGSSLAGICASQKQKAIIMVPQSAPMAKLTQIIMYGAQIVPVAGSYDDAFDLSIKATEAFGWYNRNTAFNPLTVEGKKSVSFELFAELNGRIPDRIFVPVGDGVIMSGVYKGFEELLRLGIIKTMPVMVAVQSKGSDNLVRNLADGVPFETKPSHTVADSISVDIPRNFYMAKQFLQIYDGESITVSDEEIITASKLLAKNTGIFAEPAAATAFAGLLHYQKTGKLTTGSHNVVLLTGSGLKDIQAVSSTLTIPKAIVPDLTSLKNFLP